MRGVTRRRTVLGLAAAWPGMAQAAGRRLVCVGGAVTETVFALGAGAQVVAVDSTSVFPAPVRTLPQIGYLRALAPEGLLSLSPDLLLLSDQAGPPQAIAVLRQAGTSLSVIPDEAGGAALADKIVAVAAAIGRDGAALADAVLADWRALDVPVAALPRLRALFMLSGARGAPLVAGSGTHADVMLRAAGAENVVRGFTGYRPLSAEAAAMLAPDVVVLMHHTLAEIGGAEPLFTLPALAVTPAAATRRLVAMEGAFLLGFGPRAPQARRHLAGLLHPDSRLPSLPARGWV